MKRREFLTVPVKSLGGLLVYSLAGEVIRLQAQDGVVHVPLRFFTEAEARTVRAGRVRGSSRPMRAGPEPRKRT